MVLNELLGTILQVFVFTLIPFLVYLFKEKSSKGFLDYIGLKKSNVKANLLALLVCLIFVVPLFILLFFNTDFQALMTDPKSITGKIKALGFSSTTIVIILLIALFKTSFAEEILFRGFIAKRLIALKLF